MGKLELNLLFSLNYVLHFGQIHLVHLWIHKYFTNDSSVIHFSLILVQKIVNYYYYLIHWNSLAQKVSRKNLQCEKVSSIIQKFLLCMVSQQSIRTTIFYLKPEKGQENIRISSQIHCEQNRFLKNDRFYIYYLSMSQKSRFLKVLKYFLKEMNSW